MSSGGASSGSGKDPWAWLGLLKWSLAYTDGTTDSSDISPMSAEDRAFLEAVMKEGIIDENERMRVILKETADLMEKWKTDAFNAQEEEKAEDLLQELRDIVEQIDYARAFAAMNGLQFLLGCVGERQSMPRSTRLICLGLIATLCQNNPPVQKQLLELGSIRILSELFFQEDDYISNDDGADSHADIDGALRAKIVQAVSANVRSHELAEAVFCQLDQAVPLLERGLGVNAVNSVPRTLQMRTLFLLRALITSDTSSRERVLKFNACICWISDYFLDPDKDESANIREMALDLLREVLEQKRSVNAVLSRKDSIVTTGVRRVGALRCLTGEHREFASVELELWEKVISLLARAVEDSEEATSTTTPLMLDAGNTLAAQ